MKTKSIVVIALLSLIAVLYAVGNQDANKTTKKNNRERLSISNVVITNNTRHNLKLTLQVKDSASKEQDVQLDIPEDAIGEDAVTFHKAGSLIGYKGSKFTVEIIRKVIGVRTAYWTGEFTGDDIELSHIFEYRAVVQNPVKIMSTVNLKMLISYKGNTMNILFLTPYEELD